MSKNFSSATKCIYPNITQANRFKILNNLKELAHLQSMVTKMEQDFGLLGLSPIEKKTPLAIVDLNSKSYAATTKKHI